MDKSAKPTDQQFEMFLGQLLRTGVLIAALIAFLGGVWFLAQSRGARRDYRTFHGVPAEFTNIPRVFHGAIPRQPLGGIQFGILVLIATPVARVLFSMPGFALERAWMYAPITAIVLA